MEISKGDFRVNTQQIRLGISSSLEHIALVSKAISHLVADAGVEAGQVARLELAVVEVVTNCIEHSYGFKTDQRVDVDLEITDLQVRVAVSDYGIPMPADTAARFSSGRSEIPDPGNCIDDLPESGWGINLVSNLCDELDYSNADSCNTIIMICNRGAPDEVVLSEAV